ncbi:hypothetical protein MNB_SV-12-1331 [hydrothermal vent metagenome]|uniref:Uncharacterized protein n=1 Tax=hydrothermal vent metagenome TaxID=652676 RepID=A0A1W1C1Y9_9ZZZZ
MQTLTLQVQDNFIPTLLNFLNKFQNEVAIQKDKNLELDPYFYERQQRLHKIRDDIKSGKEKLLSEEEFEKEIDLFFKELEKDL